MGLPILRVESRRRVRGSVALVVLFAVLSAMYFSMFPSFQDDIEELMAGFPDAFLEFLGLAGLDTIEGFIAAEIYSFFWVLLVGIYFAYVGAGLVATDVKTRRMDLLLSNPVSRESVLLQKVATLWVPVVALNVAVPAIVFTGSVLIGETMNPVAVAMVHLLSIPYLLVCAGIGVVISVSTDRVKRARGLAFGVVFFLWLVEGTANLAPDFEWVGAVGPSRYYDPTAILVFEEYALVDAALLSAAFVLLLAVATRIFSRRDI